MQRQCGMFTRTPEVLRKRLVALAEGRKQSLNAWICPVLGELRGNAGPAGGGKTAVTAAPPYFAPLTVGGFLHDLSHLDPVGFRCRARSCGAPSRCAAGALPLMLA